MGTENEEERREVAEFNIKEAYLLYCKSISQKSQKTVNFQDFITYRKDNIR